jgi:hypothetical protein
MLMLGIKLNSVVPLRKLLKGFYVTMCEGYRIWYELTLQAQFQQIANSSLSKQFVQELACTNQTVDVKKKKVKEEVFKNISRM